MIHNIPVAPISRKILLHDYEEEPIMPKRHDVLYHQLCYSARPRSSVSNLHHMLRSSINVNLTADQHNRRSDQLFRIGESIYIAHMERMMLFVEAQTLATGNAWAALELFYTKYEIEEDDFPLESAYKRWQRYQSGLDYNIREVSRQVKRIHPVIVQVPFSIEMCDDLYTLALCHMHQYFYTYNQCFMLHTARNLHSYLLYEYGNYSAHQIARIQGVPWITAKGRLATTKAWIKSDAEIKPALDRLSYLLRQQVASLAS